MYANNPKELTELTISATTTKQRGSKNKEQRTSISDTNPLKNIFGNRE